MKTMTNTLNIDIGLGRAASISISSGHDFDTLIWPLSIL